jgi:hypothetical protein
LLATFQKSGGCEQDTNIGRRRVWKPTSGREDKSDSGRDTDIIEEVPLNIFATKNLTKTPGDSFVKCPRVLLADDHRMLLDVLEGTAAFEIVGRNLNNAHAGGKFVSNFSPSQDTPNGT